MYYIIGLYTNDDSDCQSFLVELTEEQRQAVSVFECCEVRLSEKVFDMDCFDCGVYDVSFGAGLETITFSQLESIEKIRITKGTQAEVEKILQEVSLFNDLKEALKEMPFLEKGSDMMDEYIQLIVLKKLHYTPDEVHKSWLQFVEPDAHYDLRKSVFQANYGLTIGSSLLSGKAAEEVSRCMETPYNEGFYDYIRVVLHDMHHIQLCGFIK